MFLLRKRILEMSFGPATTFLAPRGPRNPANYDRGVPRLSVCLFVCGIYAGVYMRLSVCLFVSGMYVEFDLVATARLCRVSHKMRITKEDGDLWFNKACKSG